MFFFLHLPLSGSGNLTRPRPIGNARTDMAAMRMTQLMPKNIVSNGVWSTFESANYFVIKFL